MLVEQLMNRPPVSCSTNESLHRAAGLMIEHDCGALPVVDEAGHPCGMLTDRDICIAAYQLGLPLESITAAQAMTSEVHCCRAGDPIGVAERIMSKCQVRRVPVVDSDGLLVGMISLADLSRVADQQDGRRRQDVSDGAVSRTLAAIVQPSQPEQIIPLPPPGG
jgi:CBS domain-containing protein